MVPGLIDKFTKKDDSDSSESSDEEYNEQEVQVDN